MTVPDPTISHLADKTNPADTATHLTEATDPTDPATGRTDPATNPADKAADPTDPAANLPTKRPIQPRWPTPPTQQRTPEPATAAAALKASLRLAAVARRDALPAADRVAAARAIAAAGLPVAVGPGMVVSGYSPLKSEISPLLLLRRCADAGARLALPVVTGRGRPLVMRAWSFGAPLRPGVWGIREPPAEAEEVFPDIIIVPLLAFDRAGQRIGYGAGYYDMTLARLRAVKHVTAIGIAFAAQEIAAVPATPRDARLDLVLTERGAINFRKP